MAEEGAPRHLARDAFAMLPAILAGLSLLASLVGGGLVIVYAFGDVAFWLGLLAFSWWLLSFAIGFFAAGVAVGQIVAMRGQGRSIALPATAGLIAVLVLLVAGAPVFVSVATAIVDYALVALTAPAPTPPNLGAYSVPLTAPWTSMQLPVGSGAVLYSDSTTVTITYTGANLPALAASYGAAATSAGWTLASTNNANGLYSSTYSRPGLSLTMSVMDAAGSQTVSLTQY